MIAITAGLGTCLLEIILCLILRMLFDEDIVNWLFPLILVFALMVFLFILLT